MESDSKESQSGELQSGQGALTVKESTSNQGAAVKAALLANIGVAAVKIFAAVLTKSSSMLSEAVHSVADCSNEIVLMIGDKTAHHKINKKHPFGLYRAKYLASFVVATLLFFVGGLFSTMSAISKVTNVLENSDARIANPKELAIALIIVVISACLEGYGLRQSYKEANERMMKTQSPHMGLYKYWRRTKSAELASVIMEDTLALIGLGFAFIGIGLAVVTGDELYDALGGAAVGVLLMIGSMLLAYKSGSLLIGEAISPSTLKLIRETVVNVHGVNSILNIQAVHLSEDSILLCLKVETSKLDRDYDVDTVNKIEAAVRSTITWYEFEIYVEPDIMRPQLADNQRHDETGAQQ